MIGPIFKQFESIAFENPSLNMEPGRKGVTLGGFVILVAFARCSQINKKNISV